MYPADDWTRVTASSYPLVYAAFETIKGEHPPAYNVPPPYSNDLPSTESVLTELSENDRIKLCNNEYDPVVITFAIVAAANLFAAFTYDWPIFFMKKRKIVGS